MGRLATSRTGKMKEYVSRRRNTPRLGKDAREKILTRIVEQAPPDAPAPALLAEGKGFPVPRLVDSWNDMAHIPVDEKLLDRNLVITASRRDPVHSTFEVLRTRLMITLAEKGWSPRPPTGAARPSRRLIWPSPCHAMTAAGPF